MQVETMDAGLQAPEPMLDEMQQLAQRYARMVRGSTPVIPALLLELQHCMNCITAPSRWAPAHIIRRWLHLRLPLLSSA